MARVAAAAAVIRPVTAAAAVVVGLALQVGLMGLEVLQLRLARVVVTDLLE